MEGSEARREREKDDQSISLKIMEHCVEGGKFCKLEKVIWQIKTW